MASDRSGVDVIVGGVSTDESDVNRMELVEHVDDESIGDWRFIASYSAKRSRITY